MNNPLTRFSLKDRELFVKRLSFLISSGTPLLKSLQIIRDQAHSASQKEMFAKIADDVASGQYLATSLEKYKKAFGAFMINLIRVGETSGILDKNLIYLSQEIQKSRELKSKLISAFVYPIFITVATLGITVLLITYVFPKIIPIFKSFNARLPFTTRLLIYLSTLFSRDGWWFGLGLMVGIGGVYFVSKKPIVKRFFDQIIVKLPFVGSIIRDYNLATITRTLGLLMQSELKLLAALQIVAETNQNSLYKDFIHKSKTSIAEGEKISVQLAKNPSLFPSLVVDMIEIGETSGNLSESLLYLSNFYEKEVSDQTKNLSSSLEPLLMVVMGLIVGFIAISIITPIYQITQSIHP